MKGRKGRGKGQKGKKGRKKWREGKEREGKGREGREGGLPTCRLWLRLCSKYVFR